MVNLSITIFSTWLFFCLLQLSIWQCQASAYEEERQTRSLDWCARYSTQHAHDVWRFECLHSKYKNQQKQRLSLIELFSNERNDHNNENQQRKKMGKHYRYLFCRKSKHVCYASTLKPPSKWTTKDNSKFVWRWKKNNLKLAFSGTILLLSSWLLQTLWSNEFGFIPAFDFWMIEHVFGLKSWSKSKQYIRKLLFNEGEK